MRKRLIAFLLALFCCTACADTESDQLIDLVDEWLVLALPSDTFVIGIESINGYYLNDIAVSVENCDGIIKLTSDVEYCEYTVEYVSIRNDMYFLWFKTGTSSFFAVAVEAASSEDEIRKWQVYEAVNFTTALFTDTHMIFDDTSYEYMYKNSRIFLIESKGYTKCFVDYLCEDAFILNRSYPHSLLFIRSSLCEAFEKAIY